MKCYFFGTFNPIHLGHIEIAKKVKEKGGFDEVIFVPSFIPPHKNADLESYAHRLEMARIALGEKNVSDIERKLRIPSYTYQTAQKLYQDNNNKKINFIIGYDQFFKIESWKNPEILKETLNFIVIPRKFQNGQILSEKALSYLKNKGFSFEVYNIGLLDISSNKIRNFIKNNKDISSLTTYEVKKYIENNRLYSFLFERESIG